MSSRGDFGRYTDFLKGCETLEYWKTVTDKYSNVLSCDMLRLRLDLRGDDIHYIIDYFRKYNRDDVVEYPINWSDYKWRYMFNVNYGQSSMTVGIVFNGATKESTNNGFVEVNPNKCFNTELCLRDIDYISKYCYKVTIVRWDLAIDIPFPRSYYSLIKDGRKYSLDLWSAEHKTEYLGCRNEGGYVKLYNKSLEQKMDNVSITRLELTCADNWSADKILAKLPDVNVIPYQNELGVICDLSNTQKTLVALLNDSLYKDVYFRSLNKDMQVKLRPYVYGNSQRMKYDSDAIRTLFDIVHSVVERFNYGYFQDVPKEIVSKQEKNPFLKKTC